MHLNHAFTLALNIRVTKEDALYYFLLYLYFYLFEFDLNALNLYRYFIHSCIYNMRNLWALVEPRIYGASEHGLTAAFSVCWWENGFYIFGGCFC